MGGEMTKIVPQVYVGGWKNATNEEELIANCITHVLSVHDSKQELEKSSSREYVRIWVSDNCNQNLLKYVGECNDFIHKARLSGGNILVHCVAGVSRCIAFTVAYIMTVTGLSYKEAVGAVRGMLPSANPNEFFQCQLETFEKEHVKEERKRLQVKFGDWTHLAETDLKALNAGLDTHQSRQDNGYYPGGAPGKPDVVHASLVPSDPRWTDRAAIPVDDIDDLVDPFNDDVTGSVEQSGEHPVDILGRTVPYRSRKRSFAGLGQSLDMGALIRPGLDDYTSSGDEGEAGGSQDHEESSDDDDVVGSVPVRQPFQRFDMPPSSVRGGAAFPDKSTDKISCSMPSSGISEFASQVIMESSLADLDIGE